MRTRGLIAFGGPIAVLSFSAWGDRRFVPAGLPLRSAEPLYLWYGELGTFPWPEATNAVQVVVNDAGANLPPLSDSVTAKRLLGIVRSNGRHE